MCQHFFQTAPLPSPTMLSLHPLYQKQLVGWNIDCNNLERKDEYNNRWHKVPDRPEARRRLSKCGGMDSINPAGQGCHVYQGPLPIHRQTCHVPTCIRNTFLSEVSTLKMYCEEELFYSKYDWLLKHHYIKSEWS